MKNILYGLICLSLLVPAAKAQDKKTGGLPPLIDRDLIFGNPEIAGRSCLRMASTLRSSNRGRIRAMCMSRR